MQVHFRQTDRQVDEQSDILMSHRRTNGRTDVFVDNTEGVLYLIMKALFGQTDRQTDKWTDVFVNYIYRGRYFFSSLDSFWADRQTDWPSD